MRFSDFMTTARWLAPWTCLVVLVAGSRLLPNHTTLDPAADARKVEVAEAMASVPYLIGRWAGEDEEVPREAQKLLRPNAIFSRRYVRSDGAWAHILIVHCSDARDMIGHYPPICYKATGYVAADPGYRPEQAVWLRSGSTLPVRAYRFRRASDRGTTEIQIFNAFILPEGTTTRNIEDINRQSERLAISVQGVAQLQVITSGAMPREDALDATTELLVGMPDLWRALAGGQEDQHEDE